MSSRGLSTLESSTTRTSSEKFQPGRAREVRACEADFRWAEADFRWAEAAEGFAPEAFCVGAALSEYVRPCVGTEAWLPADEAGSGRRAKSEVRLGWVASAPGFCCS